MSSRAAIQACRSRVNFVFSLEIRHITNLYRHRYQPQPLSMKAEKSASAFNGDNMSSFDQVISYGPFQPSWDSLKQYRAPDWYQDGKFGIFIHWGLYSVPAFANEWYPRNMYLQRSPEFKHHVETYG